MSKLDVSSMSAEQLAQLAETLRAESIRRENVAVETERMAIWNSASVAVTAGIPCAMINGQLIIGNAPEAAVARKRGYSSGGNGGRSNLGGIALSGLSRDDYLISVRRYVRAASNNADGGNSYRAAGGSVAIDHMADDARAAGKSIGTAQATITARVLSEYSATKSAPNGANVVA